MKTSIYVTALNCSELYEIERAVDFFLEKLYEYAEKRDIILSNFSGEISWSVRDISHTELQRCLYFDFSIDNGTWPFGGGSNLGHMTGIATGTLFETITSRMKSFLRIIFNGKIRVKRIGKDYGVFLLG